MRASPINIKLLHCSFFLLLFGGWVSAQEVPVQDEASLREMESQELLQHMKNAPPAPMPPWAEARPEAESALGEQLISSRVNRLSSGRNGNMIDVQVDYLTTRRSLTGLGLRMHFDSSKLSLVELSDIFPAGALQHQVQEDTLDFDGDPKTDRYINIAWMDHMGSWPGTDQTQLFTATFQMPKGQGAGATTIRYSVADVAAGMDVYFEPLSIGPGNSTKAK